MTHIVRAFAPFLAILILAGCAGPTRQVQPTICPTCAPCAACPAPVPAAEAKYQPTPFTAIAGWPNAPLAAGLRAFASGCARMAAGSALRGTCEAARALKEQGAIRVVAYCTHPVLSGPAIGRIEASVIDELVVTDTIPLKPEAEACKKIRQISVAELFAETMRRICEESSVSSLFVE